LLKSLEVTGASVARGGADAGTVGDLIDVGLGCAVAEAQAVMKTTVSVATVLNLPTSAMNTLRLRSRTERSVGTGCNVGTHLQNTPLDRLGDVLSQALGEANDHHANAEEHSQ